jgi:predicted AAA+ superfamily ATPase
VASVEAVLTGLVPRRMAEVVRARLREEPVVALHGPRTVGKSTLLREIASTEDLRIFDLDDLATRDAIAADPTLFVSAPAPVCFDEYQKAPQLLDAIKAELNVDLRPGRFLLTGSTRYDALPAAAQALTGRLHVVSIYPLSQGEVAGVRENLLARLIDDPAAAVGQPTESETTRENYIDRIVAGGFPLALMRSPAARGRWFDDYVSLTLERDVAELSKIRQRELLPRLLQRLAAQTGQVLNVAAAAGATRMDAETAEAYLRLLEAVFLLQRLPAWGTTLRSRAASKPKVHVVDSGVASRLLRLTPAKLSRLDPTSLQQFGHLLETFAVGEALKQVSWLNGVAGYGHWRTYDGDEVDLVIEREDGSLTALEIKAGGRVSGSDFRGLRKLREATGAAFSAGVVLYLGSRAYTQEDRLHVLPLDRLWTELP